MKKIVSLILIGVSLLQAELFRQGDKQIGITVGSSSVKFDSPAATRNYTIVGLNAAYFPVDDLSMGVGYRGWFGSAPRISEVSIPVTYYLPLISSFRPYGGAFYRRTFIEAPYRDYNVYGLRAGLSMGTSKQSYIGFGWVQEYYENCEERKACTSGYPEVVITIGF